MMARKIVGFGPDSHLLETGPYMADHGLVEVFRRFQFASLSPHARVQRQSRGDLQEHWRLQVPVYLHQSGLGRDLVVLVLMSMTSIHARMRVMCGIVAPL
jgi:hypothetical protein